MKIIPNTAPQPRLTSSVEAAPPKAAADDSEASHVQLKRAGLFSGNGRAIFVGLTAGALLVWGAAVLFQRHPATRREAPAQVKLVAVETEAVSTAARPTEPPSVLSVQLSEEVLRVTAISLGHPRLAVINGTQVAEGDFVAVQSPSARSVTVKLRVLKIGDGRVDLTDGTQTIQTHLAIPGVSPRPR